MPESSGAKVHSLLHCISVFVVVDRGASHVVGAGAEVLTNLGSIAPVRIINQNNLIFRHTFSYQTSTCCI